MDSAELLIESWQHASLNQRDTEVAHEIRMITTFFGAHSFGGDAAYVDRLSQALCRRGHEVHVYYCVDAFNAVRGRPSAARRTRRRRGCTFIRSKSRFGILSPLATQATGLPLFKSAALRRSAR